MQKNKINKIQTIESLAIYLERTVPCGIYFNSWLTNLEANDPITWFRSVSIYNYFPYRKQNFIENKKHKLTKKKWKVSWKSHGFWSWESCENPVESNRIHYLWWVEAINRTKSPVNYSLNNSKNILQFISQKVDPGEPDSRSRLLSVIVLLR